MYLQMAYFLFEYNCFETMVKNLPTSVGNSGAVDSVFGSGRSPGEVMGYPLQYSCLENPHGQRSLAGYGPWGCKESDTKLSK